VLDMIGDIDQQIYYEANSDPAIQQAIFAQAAALGYGANFIPQLRYTMTDDHTPFLRAGVPAVDLIDFDYGPGPSPGAWWHTRRDDLSHVCAGSLGEVGTAALAAVPAIRVP